LGEAIAANWVEDSIPSAAFIAVFNLGASGALEDFVLHVSFFL
jgi:hypothetical protein